MKSVPCGALLRVTSLARIVISKTVDKLIPNRIEKVDKHCLGQRDPYIVGDEIAAVKVVELQILTCRLKAPKPTPVRRPRCHCQWRRARWHPLRFGLHR